MFVVETTITFAVGVPYRAHDKAGDRRTVERTAGQKLDDAEKRLAA